MLSKKEQEEMLGTLIENDENTLQIIGILLDQVKALAEEVRHLREITDLLKAYVIGMKQ